MKFANIERLGYIEGKNLLYIGDHIQLLAIDNLYQQMGVTEDVVHLDAWDVASYKGEKLILPINQFFARGPFLDKNSNFTISEDITPVFLGLGLKESVFHFNDENIAFLKRYAPIGCRDYYTFQRVSQHGIPAYIAGCLTMTLPKRKVHICNPKKVFLVDIPSALKKYIPADILEASEIVHQIYEISEKDFKDLYFAKKTTKELFERYQEEAALIITYRMHCAAPCLAMGIPVIIARPYRAYPCDWLEQFSHIYTEEEYAGISWNVKPIDIEPYKEIAKKVAIKRLENTCSQEDISELHKYHLRGYSSNYIPEDMSINHFILEIERRFRKEDHFDYAMWGISDVAEKVYEYLSLNYPNAKLVKVIDSFSEKTFHGIVSEKPEILSKDDPFITIATTIGCIQSGAMQLFTALGKDASQYIYASDTFV